MGRAEQIINAHQTQSSSSSSDSSNYPSAPPAASNFCFSNVCGKTRTNLSTDLRLDLTISPSSQPDLNLRDWPPIKSTLKSNLVEKQRQLSQRPSLFVKVYMEGNAIGRKLNLLAHHSYDGLVKALGHMFRTIILCPNSQPLRSGNFHVLTYEDEEGDWMMVGDVPWKMFLKSGAKRLKITRADRCYLNYA